MTQSEFAHILSVVHALSPDQMRQLARALEDRMTAADHRPAPAELTAEERADQEFQRRLFDAGVISEIKPPKRASTGTERFTPVVIQGEPLSETIIRERR